MSRPDPIRPWIVAIAVLALLHHADHVLRADHSGWPFQPEVTPFTYTLIIYLMLVVDYFARSRPRLRAGLLSLGVVLLLGVHLTIETPSDLYKTWATGASTSEANPGVSNLLGVSSPLLGIVSNVVLAGLLAALIITIVKVLRRARAAPAP
ncbi:MAG: hypothetical protein ACR2FO_00235 [Actinomycetota bacterium]